MKRLAIILVLPGLACQRLAAPPVIDPAAATPQGVAHYVQDPGAPPPAPDAGETPPPAPETSSAGEDAMFANDAPHSDDAVTVVPPAPQVDAGPGHQRTRSGFFWAGVAMAAAGGGLFLGTAIGGRVTQGQLNKGYEDNDLTYDRESKLRDRGKLFNSLAAAGGAIALTGIITLAVAYGIDYAHCGKLAKRRKDCPRRAAQ